MKTTVSQYDFTEAFKDYGRSDNFSYEGLKALFDYLEDLESDIGEQIELDVIAICCDFSEYDTALEAARYYGCDYTVELYDDDDEERDEDEIEEELEEYCIEWLRDRTPLIEFDDGVIIQNF